MISSSSSYIPWEIMVDILCRLPAKSLIRFRCVSTFWFRLIDSSDFVKSHLNRASENNPSDLSLVLRDTHHRLMVVGFDSISNDDNNVVVPVVYTEVRYRHAVCGSCNGIVCLSADEFEGPSLALWNPCTRKLRKLPRRWISRPLARHINGQAYVTYGFGYDHVNDDYKVVRIIMAAGNITENKLAGKVDVYSLNSNSWRSVEKPPGNVYFRHSDLKKGKLAGGAIHWGDFGEPDSAEIHRIIAFDLVTEEYRFVQIPEYSNLEYPLSLKSFDGCLSVICIDFGRDFNPVEIWVMKEYGVKESWAKLISLAYPLSFQSIISLCPLAYSDDRSEILLHDGNKLAWFSLEGKMLDKTVGIDGNTDVCDFDTCLETLVPLMTHVSSSKNEQK